MAWVRIDDQAPRNEKLLRAGPAAAWLWVCGLAHCQAQLTDGFVSETVLPMIGVVKGYRELARMLVGAGLWVPAEGGFSVNDYLEFNESRETVIEKRAADAKRKAKKESAQIPAGVRAESIRTPSAPSHPIPSHPKEQDLRAHETVPPRNDTGLQPLDAELSNRAAAFVDKYADLFTKHRAGARWLRRKPNLEWDAACGLCRTWDDARLEKMAVIFLTTDDDWIARTDRGFAVFVSRATWCDERLAQWEATQKVSA